MKLKKTAAETSLAPVARTLKSCSSRLYPWIMSSNETCAPSPPCSFSSTGPKCSFLSSLRRLVQASRVNLSFSFFHEANRLSNATWKSSKRKKSHHVISGREARKCTKYNINPIPATWGGLHKTPSIFSKPLTLWPPNLHRLSNLLAESKYPSKYILNEKYLDSKVFDKIMQNLPRIRLEALIGSQRTFIVLTIVYEWQTINKRPQRSYVNAMNL